MPILNYNLRTSWRLCLDPWGFWRMKIMNTASFWQVFFWDEKFKRGRFCWNLWCPMIGTFNVSSCSERFIFHSFYKIPSAKYCEGSKMSSSERYGGSSNLRKWMCRKDSKKNYKHDAKRCNDTKHFTTCLPNWLTSGEVTVFWKFSPPSPPPQAELVEKLHCSTEVSCIAWMSQVRDWF